MGKTRRSSKKSAGAVVGGCTHTSGENFPDAMIELVRRTTGSRALKLLLWDGAVAKVDSRLEYGRFVYEPVKLGPTVSEAVQWPKCPIPFRSTKDLYGEVLSLIMQNINIEETSARLLTYFVFTTWFPERLSLMPGLAILGPADNEGVQLLKILRCMCRRSILLADVSQSNLSVLPLELSPTLLIHRPSVTRQFRNFMATSNRAGLSTIKKGRILDLCCPKAVYVGMDPIPEDVAAVTIQVSLSGQAPRSALENGALNKIAAEFQGKMLGYRLTNFSRIRVSPIRHSGLTYQTREFAMNLAACIVDNPELSEGVIPLLKKQDDNIRGQLNRKLDEAILGALLTCFHERKNRRVQVKEIASLANALLRSQGELSEYKPEEIGHRLDGFALRRTRQPEGMFLVLSDKVSRLVHTLALEYGAAWNIHAPACRECKLLKDGANQSSM